MKINQKVLGLTVIIIMLGTVFITSALGIFKTTNSKVPQKFQSGEYQNQYNPADIRGSYTFAEISKLYQIPIEDLTASFSLDLQDISAKKCKDLENMFDSTDGKEIGTGSVKLFVALYKGLPYTSSETTYLPALAEEVLLKAGNMTDEQKQYVSSHKK